jgi:HK97 family phage major capsid protein
MENVRSVDELKTHLDKMKAEFYGLKKAERELDDAAVRKAAAYSKAFWEHMHTGMPENALREGSDGAGGYLVPDEYEDKLVEGLKEHNILRSLAHTIPTTHDLRIPVVLSKGTAQWVNESGDYTDTEPCFGQTVISAHKVATSVLYPMNCWRTPALISKITF